MPEYLPPHVDQKDTIDEKHRLKMLELAIEGIDGLGIETIELERKGVSYTYETMKLMTEKILMWIIISSSVQIWWIICQNGTKLMNLSKWCNSSVCNVQNTRQGRLIL